MNGGKDCEAGDERQAVPVQVPIGWRRKAEHGGGVVYVRWVLTTIFILLNVYKQNLNLNKNI